VNTAQPESGESRPADRAADRPVARRDVVFAVRRTAPARRRFRWRRWVVSAAAALVLGTGAWWLTQSGVFAVSRLGTGAYRFTDERALKSALAPLLGRNLWALDQGDVKDALAPLPWVRDVYVQRRLPGAVDIELIEWRPILVVAESGAPAGAPTLVLVEDGRVLPFPPRLPAPVLPVLTGLVVERSATGPARLPAAMRPAVLDLVAAIEQSGLEAVTPIDFVVARPEGFGIVLQDTMGTLLVGREDFTARLDRYLMGRDNVGKGLEIDLRFENRLTVRAPEKPADEEGAEGEEGEEGGKPGDSDAEAGRGSGKKKQQENQAGAGRKTATKERA
jgi:cell division septal protein FtsQ